MSFPPGVRSVIENADERAWPVEGQGVNECGCTVAANALNVLCGERRFTKDAFVQEAGLWFQRGMGGTPGPITGRLIRRHGFGTHYGNLSYTNYERVLCDLIDRHVPVALELWAFRVPWLNVAFYGQHAVLLVGYRSQQTQDEPPVPEEFYFVDSQWPALGKFTLEANNRDADGDGKVEVFPGNRTLSRAEFQAAYPLYTYYPVFPSQAEHDAWYAANMRPLRSLPLVGGLIESTLTGSYDLWSGGT